MNNNYVGTSIKSKKWTLHTTLPIELLELVIDVLKLITPEFLVITNTDPIKLSLSAYLLIIKSLPRFDIDSLLVNPNVSLLTQNQ